MSDRHSTSIGVMQQPQAVPVPAPGFELPIAGLVRAGLAAGVVCALAFAVSRFGATTALVVAGVAAIACVVCVHPTAAVFVAAIALYSNVVVVFFGTPLYQVVGASSVLLLGVAAIDRVLIRKEYLVVDRVFSLMVLYLIALLASTFLAEDMPLAITEIVQYVTEGLLIYVLVINVVRTRRQLYAVFGAVTLTCAILSSMTVYQAVTGNYEQQFAGFAQRLSGPEPVVAPENENEPVPIATPEEGLGTEDRAAGPIGDPNRYAQILLIALPWALYFTRHARNPLSRLLCATAATLMLAAVALTYSRGAFLTLAILVLFLLAWRYVRPARVALAAVAFAIALAVVAPDYFSRMASIGSVSVLGSEDAATEPDGAIRGRATEMLAALAVFLDYPFLGVGPGQYVPYYSERYQLIEDLRFRYLPRPREAHNLFVSIAAETGAAGLLVFLGVLGMLFFGLYWARRYWVRRHRAHADLAAACALSLVGYVGTGMFLHLSYERYFWFLVGIASAAIHVLRQEQRREYAREAETWRRP